MLFGGSQRSCRLLKEMTQVQLTEIVQGNLWIITFSGSMGGRSSEEGEIKDMDRWGPKFFLKNS